MVNGNGQVGFGHAGITVTVTSARDTFQVHDDRLPVSPTARVLRSRLREPPTDRSHSRQATLVPGNLSRLIAPVSHNTSLADPCQVAPAVLRWRQGVG